MERLRRVLGAHRDEGEEEIAEAQRIDAGAELEGKLQKFGDVGGHYCVGGEEGDELADEGRVRDVLGDEEAGELFAGGREADSFAREARLDEVVAFFGVLETKGGANFSFFGRNQVFPDDIDSDRHFFLFFLEFFGICFSFSVLTKKKRKKEK